MYKIEWILCLKKKLGQTINSSLWNVRVCKLNSPRWSILQCSNSWQDFSASLVKNSASVLKSSAPLKWSFGDFLLKKLRQNWSQDFWPLHLFLALFFSNAAEFSSRWHSAQDYNRFSRVLGNRNGDICTQFSEIRRYLKVKIRLKEHNFKI